MKKLLISNIGAAALIIGVASSAMAADLPAKVPPYKAPAAPYNWTGCYVGGNLAAVYGTTYWSVAAPTAPAGAAISSQDMNDLMGGVQAGCNYQVAAWVFGMHGDYDWTKASGSNSDNVAVALTDESHISSISSVTGRLGYAIDRYMGYVKGGGAWEHDTYNTYVTIPNIPFSSASETRTGWTAGIGFEAQVVSNMTMFIDFSYFDFGTRTNTFVSPAGPQFANIRETQLIAKVGVNWRFLPW
jgi:outer membrane immunogenic protein